MIIWDNFIDDHDNKLIYIFFTFLSTMNGNASHPPPVLSASSNGLYESDNPSDWQPYRDGEAAIRDAHKNLSSDDW